MNVELLLASCSTIGSHAAAGMTNEWEDDHI